jgi:translation initiation factor 1
MSNVAKKPPVKPVAPEPVSRLVSSPFAGLAAIRESLPAAEPAGVSPAVAVRTKSPGPARAVVRLEKKGRGGKEATYIEKLELAPKELDVWCKALKQSMGCGGVVEDGAIILQGDLRQRLTPVLTARGVRKVIISG